MQYVKQIRLRRVIGTFGHPANVNQTRTVRA